MSTGNFNIRYADAIVVRNIDSTSLKDWCTSDAEQRRPDATHVVTKLNFAATAVTVTMCAEDAGGAYNFDMVYDIEAA